MKIPKYRNARTKREAIIIQETKVSIQIEYIYSGYKKWFSQEDFNKLFTEIKE